MKILLVSSFFPPTHTAGTEKRTLGYALALRELDHEVQVVCVGDWERGSQYWNGYRDELFQGIPVRRVNLNWTLAPDPNRFLVQNPIVYSHLKEWLRTWQPDIVHVTSCLTLSASVIQAAKATGISVVLTLTDFWFICPRSNLLRGDGKLCDGLTTNWECLKCKTWDTKAYPALRLFMPEDLMAITMTWVSKHGSISRIRGLRGYAIDMEHRRFYLSEAITAADKVIAPSAYLRDVFLENGISIPITLILSGHDLSWLETMPKNQNRPDDMVRVGYIGQIIHIKGVHTLIEAFKNADLAKQAQLLVYGDHEREKAYEAYLKALRTGQEETIKLQGAFPHEQLGDVLSTIDVLVVPSMWHENNPRVIQEAFATKTPVIASDVGGNREFVQHEVNGLLFERGRDEDLVKQLRRIVQEPDLLTKLQAGIQPVKTIQEEVSELDTIYQNLARRDLATDNPPA